MSDKNLSTEDKIAVMDTFLKMDRVNAENEKRHYNTDKRDKLIIPYAPKTNTWPIDPDKLKRSFLLESRNDRLSTNDPVANGKNEQLASNFHLDALGSATSDESQQPCDTCGGKGRKPPPKADPELPYTDIKTLNNCRCRTERKSACHCQRTKRSEDVANTWYVFNQKPIFSYKNQLPYTYLGIQYTT